MEKRFLILLLFATMIIQFSIVSYNADDIAFAQYYQPGTSTATPTQLQECKKLGISSDNCNDLTILQKERCLGGEEAACSEFSPGSPRNADYSILLYVLIGLVIAFVVGIIIIKKISASKKAVNRSL
jgi:hypothetical protein